MSFQDAPSWTPSVQDVALRLIARTRINNGTLAGTFNSQTNPTDTQVSGLITQAVNLLRPRLGPVPDRLSDTARAITALKTAVMVEESYFMEQVQTEMSPCRMLTAEYMDALKSWDVAAKGDEPNGTHIASMPVGTLYPGYATGTY